MNAVRNIAAALAALLIAAGSAPAAEIDALISTAVKAATDEIVPPFETAPAGTSSARHTDPPAA